MYLLLDFTKLSPRWLYYFTLPPAVYELYHVFTSSFVRNMLLLVLLRSNKTLNKLFEEDGNMNCQLKLLRKEILSMSSNWCFKGQSNSQCSISPVVHSGKSSNTKWDARPGWYHSSVRSKVWPWTLFLPIHIHSFFSCNLFMLNVAIIGNSRVPLPHPGLVCVEP